MSKFLDPLTLHARPSVLPNRLPRSFGNPRKLAPIFEKIGFKISGKRRFLVGYGSCRNQRDSHPGHFMHELSIAESILDIIRQNVPREELGNVYTVNMKVGEMAGVVCDSLEFSFQALTAGTPLAKASLSIDHIPFQIHCRSCDKTLQSQFGLSVCPWCSGIETNVVSGTELQVVSIDLREPVSEAP